MEDIFVYKRKAMKSSICTLFLITLFAINSIYGQSKILSKLYFEINAMKLTTGSSFLHYGAENKMIKIFPSVEMGITISEKWNFGLGYANRNHHDVREDISNSAVLTRSIITGYEIFAGIEYYPIKYNIFQFGVNVDGFYRYEDQYYESRPGFIISPLKNYLERSTYGISTNIQLKMNITDHAEFVIAAGFDRARLYNKTTPLDLTNWPVTSSERNSTEINLLNRIALRFRF